MTVIATNGNCINAIDMLLRKGVTAIGRYYRVVHPTWRLTRAEAQTLSGADIRLFTVYEDTGHDLALTAAQGVIDGLNALEQAATVDQPYRSAIYFSLQDPDGHGTHDLPAIRDYFTGVKASIGSTYRLGVLSNGVVCRALLDEGICSYAWLSASWSQPGTREFYRSSRWHLAQSTPVDQNWGGLSVDVNEARDDFGAFSVRVLVS
jgi:hypothetical protein